MRPALIALFVLSLLAASGAFARTVYKWTDDNGQVNYTAEPPQNRPSQKLDLHTALPTGSQSSEGTGSAPQAPADGQSAQNSQQASSDDVPKGNGTAYLSKQCARARQNLKALRAGGTNRRFRDADGNVVRFNEKQLQSKIDDNRQYLDTYCKQQ